jgi:hypothetical protein
LPNIGGGAGDFAFGSFMSRNKIISNRLFPGDNGLKAQFRGRFGRDLGGAFTGQARLLQRLSRGARRKMLERPKESFYGAGYRHVFQGIACLSFWLFEISDTAWSTVPDSLLFYLGPLMIAPSPPLVAMMTCLGFPIIKAQIP